MKLLTLEDIKDPYVAQMNKSVKKAIKDRLAHFNFHRTKAAESLGISREHLWTLMNKYDLHLD